MRTKNQSVWGFTLIELLVVIVIIAILVALLFPAIKQALLKAEAAKARTTILSAATAFKAFNNEYGRWPGNPTTPAGPQLLSTNFFGSNYGNTRNIVFLDTSSKDIDPATGNILDPWKNPYRVAFDASYTNSIANPFGAPPNPITAGVIVWSCGPDAASSDGLNIGPTGSSANPGSSANDADNIVSW